MFQLIVLNDCFTDVKTFLTHRLILHIGCSGKWRRARALPGEALSREDESGVNTSLVMARKVIPKGSARRAISQFSLDYYSLIC